MDFRVFRRDVWSICRDLLGVRHADPVSDLDQRGEKGGEITEQIIGFVENMNVGVLGSLGLGLLMLTVVSLMQKIERAVNFAWRITQHRSFAQRFSSYLTVIVIGPVLVFSAVGITASLVAAPLVTEFTAREKAAWCKPSSSRSCST